VIRREEDFTVRGRNEETADENTPRIRTKIDKRFPAIVVRNFFEIERKMPSFAFEVTVEH
jgi:hypothetical protein